MVLREDVGPFRSSKTKAAEAAFSFDADAEYPCANSFKISRNLRAEFGADGTTSKCDTRVTFGVGVTLA
jgi:hypothetical protein